MEEIDAIISSVTRHAHRVKNAGNVHLYRKGLSTARAIKKTIHLPAARRHAADYLDTIKKKYPGTADMISNVSFINMADTYTLGMNQIDFDEIAKFEGQQQTDGYVPEQHGVVIDHSGVTIGTGVDLGQMSASQINNLDISPELRAQLLPYAGLTGAAAQNALAAASDKNGTDTGLTISDADADALDNAIQEKFTNSLIKKYNASGSNANFYALPPDMQTVIASVAYQYGDLATKCPAFWAAVTAQNWTAAEQELQNFGDHYPTRRAGEAVILQNGINKLNAAPTPSPTPTPPPVLPNNTIPLG